MNLNDVANRNKDWWQEAGKQLGYPQCCIDSFCNLEHLGEPDRKLTGTGYIPCAACNTKSIQALFDTINLNRDPNLPPFPLATRSML